MCHHDQQWPGALQTHCFDINACSTNDQDIVVLHQCDFKTMQLCSCSTLQYVVSQKHINDCVALLEVQASWDYTLTETGEWLYTFMPGNIIWLCTIADLDDGVPEQASHDGLLALTYGEEEIEERHASGDNMGMNLEGGKGQGKAKGKVTKGNAKGRAKGNAMGKGKGKGKNTRKIKSTNTVQRQRERSTG